MPLVPFVPLAAQTVDYQFDDGTFEHRIEPGRVQVFEVAQQFVLPARGRLDYVEACFWREEDDENEEIFASFNVFSDDGGEPGELIGDKNSIEFLIGRSEPATWECVRRFMPRWLARNIEIYGGPFWIGVFWSGERRVVTPDGPKLVKAKSLGADLDGPASARVRTADVNPATDEREWRAADPRIRAAAIRIGIGPLLRQGEEPDPNPDPDPAPDPRITRYQPDDGSLDVRPLALETSQLPIFEWDDRIVVDPITGESSPGLYDKHVYQGFRLERSGDVDYLEACFRRDEDDPVPDHAFTFRVFQPPSEEYLPTGEDTLGQPIPVVRRIAKGIITCFRERPPERIQVGPGLVYVSVQHLGRWGTLLHGPGDGSRYKRLAVDYDGPADEPVLQATRGSSGSVFGFPDPEAPIVKAIGIRLGVDHEPAGSGFPDPPSSEGYSDCRPTAATFTFAGGHEVSMCYETADGEVGEGKGGLWTTDQSGLAWFFSRDNAEVLVKVLDACATNGHHWVFVAPVTDLAMNLYVSNGEGRFWSYHSRQGETATSRADTAAFPCAETPSAAASGPAVSEADGEYTDCVPETAPLVFGDYSVSMCYETPDGDVGEARSGIWASGQSGLLWFFSRDNPEVLIKVLDGCEINGRRWVFVGPATTLAFNLRVTDTEGRSWTHRNRQGQTADARRDTAAFGCAAEDP
ncbi:MAG: hypothetical protein OXH70_19285 [Acidobacteria bacterium]|nr:hypothetical protein [Acidobacteriota bacterium]